MLGGTFEPRRGRATHEILLLASSFVDVLETALGDPATVGWPVARNLLMRLRESLVGQAATVVRV